MEKRFSIKLFKAMNLVSVFAVASMYYTDSQVAMLMSMAMTVSFVIYAEIKQVVID
jgi:hypothetical protein